MVNHCNTQSIFEKSAIAFGTSGARGLVVDFTVEVCAAFTHAFLKVVQSKGPAKRMALAIDNRPSSYAMAMACAKAAEQVGVEVVYYGVVPTPALAYAAIKRNIPSIMVTGSHIPFDRNGLKFYLSDGEITKSDEKAILAADVSFAEIDELPDYEPSPVAGQEYIARYTAPFSSKLLAGKKIGIYEHSSAGRDLYSDLFQALGADVVSIDRTDTFVPIDTEAVAEEDKEKARHWSQQYRLDAIFSTDGDGDRPLLADENGEWLRGDILGWLCSQAMHIEALAVPVSCNTIIKEVDTVQKVVRTKIGSPYVIAEFTSLNEQFHTIAGFEANGGFLLGSDVVVNGHVITALPTRDAVLPVLMVLAVAHQGGIAALVADLPQRKNHSDRIKNFATIKSQKIIAEATKDPQALLDTLGFNAVTVQHVDTTDGLRLILDTKDIIHLRPSGNAPELRCYVESENAENALKLVTKVLGSIGG